MGTEADAQIILALSDVVDSLIEQAERQQENVQGMLSAGSEAIDAVSLAGKEHRKLAKELPTQVKEVITGALDGAAGKAARILASKFEEANQQAELAANRYETAARTLGWKTIAVVTGAWIATVATATLTIWYTSAETQALRQDSAMLETVMTYLKGSPQGAQIARCGTASNLLCVYVQTAKGRWELQRLAGPTGTPSSQ